MINPVILEAVRTPYGKRKGGLRETRPDALLASTIDGLLARAGVSPDAIGDVIAGCVTPVGEQAANIARLAVLLSKLPHHVPGVSLNRMCGSSQQAAHFAAQAVAAGDMDYVIACGVESMTRVPMFSDITMLRPGYTGFENLNPALFEKVDLIHQVESAERIADKWSISREECDAFSKESHRRAHTAGEAGKNREILSMPGLDAEDNPVTLSRDEGVRGVIDDARMASMVPVFREPGKGVVTAANASQISDGASAVLIANEARARADGFKPRAKFLARVAVGSDPTLQLDGVIPAAQQALKRAGMTIGDIDWIEINEAFATVVLSWARELKPDMARVNPWGGAIAHGHPLGASGGGLMAKMLAGLEATGKETGLQVMCIGHGMATCTIIQRV